MPTEKHQQSLVDKSLYQSMLGALNYLVQTCRPDIAHAVNSVFRYGSNPSPAHFTAMKRILHYLRGTSGLGLTYGGNNTSAQTVSITVFTDAV